VALLCTSSAPYAVTLISVAANSGMQRDQVLRDECMNVS
jgi:hypothetical protein